MKTTTIHTILLAAALALPMASYTSAAHAAESGDEGQAPFAHGGPSGPAGFGAHGIPAGLGGPGGRPRGQDEDRADGDMGGYEDGHEGGRQAGHGGPGGPGGRRGMPPFGPGPGMGGPVFPHGLALSEAQDDKVFAILHAQQPYLREQGKAAKKAHEALVAMGNAAQFDDAKAAVLAHTEAQAAANITLQHVRTRQKLLAVLTPEQRKQLDEHEPRHMPHP